MRRNTNLLLNRPTPEHVRRRRRAATDALHIVMCSDSHVWNLYDGVPDDPNATSNTRFYYTAGDKLRDLAAQVNALTTPPAAVLHNGDFTDRGGDFSLFLARWALIVAGGAPKFLNIGNHDFNFTPPTGVTKHDYAAAALGFDTRPAIAGSKFNHATTITQNGITATMLTIDTNRLDGSDQFIGTGHYDQDTLTWLETAITTSPHDLVLLSSHHGPFNYTGFASFFDDDDAFALRDIVDAAVAARPSLVVRYLYGHNHTQMSTSLWNNLGPNLIGLLGPAVVELNPAGYLHAYVFADGYIYWDMHQIAYPYTGP